jgi:hypothetical protein
MNTVVLLFSFLPDRLFLCAKRLRKIFKIEFFDYIIFDRFFVASDRNFSDTSVLIQFILIYIAPCILIVLYRFVKD